MGLNACSHRGRPTVAALLVRLLLGLQGLVPENELDVVRIVDLVAFGRLNRDECILEVHDGTLDTQGVNWQDLLLCLLRKLLLLLLCLRLLLRRLRLLLLQ